MVICSAKLNSAIKSKVINLYEAVKSTGETILSYCERMGYLNNLKEIIEDFESK